MHLPVPLDSILRSLAPIHVVSPLRFPGFRLHRFHRRWPHGAQPDRRPARRRRRATIDPGRRTGAGLARRAASRLRQSRCSQQTTKRSPTRARGCLAAKPQAAAPGVRSTRRRCTTATIAGRVHRRRDHGRDKWPAGSAATWRSCARCRTCPPCSAPASPACTPIRRSIPQDACAPNGCFGRRATWSGSTNESLMDAVTAISGSGPAYVFLLAEAMLDAAARPRACPPTRRARWCCRPSWARRGC